MKKFKKNQRNGKVYLKFKVHLKRFFKDNTKSILT